MFQVSQLLLFLGTSVALTLAPGPDIIFLLSQGIFHGRRAGLSTALGLASGNLVHTLAAVLGISVIFRSSPVAFHLLKFAGAGYLLYLAWRAWRAEIGAAGAVRSPVLSPGKLYVRGFLMNVLNPKVALFFLAFLPQFVTSPPPAVEWQLLVLGLLFTFQVVVVFGSVGLLAGELGTRLQRLQESHGRWFARGTALIFVSLGLRLLLLEK